MKRSLSIILSLLILFAVGSSLTVSVGADFGDFGGDADYGGGYDDYDYSYDYDDDYDFDSYGSTVRGAADKVSTAATVIIVAVVIILVVNSMRRGKGTNSVNVSPGYVTRSSASAGLAPMTAFHSVDPDFSEEEFKEWITNSYVRLQTAWQRKDLSSVQTILSDAYYAQMTTQLDRYVKSHTTNVIDHPAVLGVNLLGWKNEAGRDVIVANVSARIKDYVISDDTGEVIGGDAEHEKFMEYEWSVSRTGGVKTERERGTVAANCPNCGAPIDLNRSAVCPYCDSVITSGKFDWVITNIRGLSQRTAR